MVLLAMPAAASEVTVPVHRISEDGVGERAGEIRARQVGEALELVVSLRGFTPGWHAMHVHENPDCGAAEVEGKRIAGAAAGPHYDPTGVMQMKMQAEAGPRDGKAREDAPMRQARPLGDLPAVHVGADGTSAYRIVTYRLSLAQISGRAVMLHEYGEAPEDPDLPVGGGARIACGVIP